MSKFTHPFHLMILPHPYFCHLVKTRIQMIFKQDSEMSLPLDVGSRPALFYASDFGAAPANHILDLELDLQGPRIQLLAPENLPAEVKP